MPDMGGFMSQMQGLMEQMQAAGGGE